MQFGHATLNRQCDFLINGTRFLTEADNEKSFNTFHLEVWRIHIANHNSK